MIMIHKSQIPSHVRLSMWQLIPAVSSRHRQNHVLRSLLFV